ncbi:hypothetical protein C810_01425 [Lachnospiraceae bacterium A2]|nr:hypothetical protein C810_01425 [Lachnospiraceae bacterium A2]
MVYNEEIVEIKGKIQMKKYKNVIMISILLALHISLNVKAECIHEWTEWKTLIEPTCSEEGYQTRECLKCYESDSRYIPETGIHTWTEWKADDVLCADGKYTRECKECYKTETKFRKGNGNHRYSKWYVITEANCTNNGKKERECLDCFYYEYEIIPSNSSLHEWSSWSSIVYATALKTGKSERECYVCHTVEVKKTKKLKAKITLSLKKKILKVGKSFTLGLKRYTYGDKISKFLSSNKKVATVNKKGRVTAKKKGKAKITVRMKSGCKATCNVTVK